MLIKKIMSPEKKFHSFYHKKKKQKNYHKTKQKDVSTTEAWGGDVGHPPLAGSENKDGEVEKNKVIM